MGGVGLVISPNLRYGLEVQLKRILFSNVASWRGCVFSRSRCLILLFLCVALCPWQTTAFSKQRKSKRTQERRSIGDATVYSSLRSLSTKEGYADTLRSSSGGRSGRRRSAPKLHYTWKVDSNLPITRIEIRIDHQKIRVYQGDDVRAESPVSTGREGYETKKGSYRICEKDKDHKSSLYGAFVSRRGKIVNMNANASDDPPAGCHYEPSPMPYFLRLTDCGVGMHAGFVPGYPASHGCIRLPPEFAGKLFAVVRIGTPVQIVP